MAIRGSRFAEYGLPHGSLSLWRSPREIMRAFFPWPASYCGQKELLIIGFRWNRIGQPNGVIGKLGGNHCMVEIQVINASTVVPDVDLDKVCQALQRQVSDHYAPAWGMDARLLWAQDKSLVLPKAWQLIILDDADQAGALGYHDLTKSGMPIGKVFAKTDIKYGTPWSITASHELLEMMGDPSITSCVLREDLLQLVALENCDAPEADQYAYEIDGVKVSDFVFPSWFQDFWEPGQTQFDYGKYIEKPFELLPGGYIGVFNIKNGLGWQQLTFEQDGSPTTIAPIINPKARAHIGSRRERRRTVGSQWINSTR